MLPMHVLAHAEGQRLLKAVESLVSGAFAVTLAQQSAQEIRGFVTNGAGREYGIVLSEGQAFCSCRDAMYRQALCKHAIALALFALRQPHEGLRPCPIPATPSQPAAFHLGDRVRRDGRLGTVVCVSGEVISVKWDSGRTSPHAREELQAA